MRGDGRLLRRTESPYWWCAYYDAKGVEKREVCLNRKGEKLEATAENEEAARKYLRNLVDAVRAEKHGAPAFLGPEVRRQTVNEILNKLEKKYEEPDEHGVCRRVGPAMKSHIKRLRNYFGDTRAVGVTDERVAAFKRDLLTQGKKKATVNRSLQLLKQAYKVSKLTAPEIKLFDESDNVRKGKLNEIEVNRVAASLPAYLADVVRFAYETGARAGEILKLEWGYVRGSVIYVPGAITKNGDPRQIVITDRISEILERRRAARAETCNLIFHNEGNAIIDYRKAWHSACVINGLGRFYCRICRDDKGSMTRCWTPSGSVRNAVASGKFHDTKAGSCTI